MSNNADESLKYEPSDQMIVSAARQIRDHEAIYVGLGLPMVAALLAKYTMPPTAPSLSKTALSVRLNFPCRFPLIRSVRNSWLTTWLACSM
jgi:hypothetical protein